MAGWAGGEGGEGKDNCLGRHFSGGTILGVYSRGRGNFPEHNFLGGFFWDGGFFPGVNFPDTVLRGFRKAEVYLEPK